jgi:hypothetical protein
MRVWWGLEIGSKFLRENEDFEFLNTSVDDF